ncbi:MAG: BrnA antitoxin family protein [Actinomycetia bacterium]|nr:BrnA antitoxin family protein [Actinomycetes bacterium]
MKKKEIPRFQSLEEEREFWDKHDTTEYFDGRDEAELLILGGPKSEVINIRIEPQVKVQIERLARLNNDDISDLVREWIYSGIERGIGKRDGAPSADGEETGYEFALKELSDDVHRLSGMVEEAIETFSAGDDSR